MKLIASSIAFNLFFCLAGSLAMAQETANLKPQVLRVLSYNIHHAEGVDGQLDLPRIAGVIKSVQPDIVALQEVDNKVQRSQNVDQAMELGKLTGMQHAFGGNIELQGGHYGNAVLTRHEMKMIANHKLPNIDKGEQRGVLEVQVMHAGKPLRVLATHFDHRRDPRERMESAAKVNELVPTQSQAQPQSPSLLIGDLNAAFESDVLKSLRQVWQLTNTSSLPTIPVSRPERQIDFVLTFPEKAWEVVSVRVLEEAIASDHRPIFAELKLR